MLDLFSGELIIGGNFAFQNGLGSKIKTVASNSPRAYIREGLLSVGHFTSKILGGLFSGVLISFRGGGGIIGILRYLLF